MQLRSEQDILDLIARDQWRMECLRAARQQQLPDWWLAAGFVRNAVWDALHDYPHSTPLNDIDVVYFDPQQLQEEKHIENALRRAAPIIQWEVVNQATVHEYNDHPPYTSSEDAISYWIESATCVGVRLNEDDSLELCAPAGLADLLQGRVRLNPKRPDAQERFEERLTQKHWFTFWPDLKQID